MKCPVFAAAVNSAIFTALFVALFTSALLYPVIIDIWVYLPISDIGEAIQRQYERYFKTNPRIGELALIAGASTPVHRAIACTGGTVLLLASAITLVSGRLPALRSATDGIVALIMIATFALLNERAGGQLFYLPHNANYILGFGLMLMFLAAFAWAVRRDIGSHWMMAPLIPAGLLAGMSNEHTVPAILALLVVSMFFARWKQLIRFHAWHFGATGALLIGYGLLIFAPGQRKRYDGMAETAFDISARTLFSRLEKVLDALLHSPFAVTAIVAGAAAAAVLTWRQPRNGDQWTMFICLASLGAALGMAVTTIASPIIAPRLMVASHVALSMSAACSILILCRWRPFLLVAGGVAAAIAAVFLVQCFGYISLYQNQYQARLMLVEHQKEQGCRHVVVPQYDLPEESAFVLYLEHPSEWLQNLISGRLRTESLEIDIQSSSPVQHYPCREAR